MLQNTYRLPDSRPAPRLGGTPHVINRAASANPWQLWSPGAPAEQRVLSVAELAECRCPDLCNRDHVNE